MRYTEYHANRPVIRNKDLLPGAMKKLAKLEDNLEKVGETVCDEVCECRAGKLPYAAQDTICDGCKFAELFKTLVGEADEYSG